MKVRDITLALVGSLTLLLTGLVGPVAADGFALPGGSGYKDGNPDSANEDHICTLGFNANNANGDRVSITAGHCGREGEDEYVGSYSKIGTLNRRVYGRAGDYAVIGKDQYSQYALPYRVISAKKAGETLEVRHAKEPDKGETVCWTGQTSDATKCGNITAVHVPADFGDHVVDNTFTIGGCMRPGDSGGPIFAIRHDSTRNVDYAVAVGILIGYAPPAACTNNDHVVAQPILPILKDFNLTIP